MATVLNDRSCVHTLAANTADRAYTYTAYLYGETNTAGRRRGTLCKRSSCTVSPCKSGLLRRATLAYVAGLTYLRTCRRGLLRKAAPCTQLLCRMLFMCNMIHNLFCIVAFLFVYSSLYINQN